jgi:hypothetical protein
VKGAKEAIEWVLEGSGLINMERITDGEETIDERSVPLE